MPCRLTFLAWISLLPIGAALAGEDPGRRDPHDERLSRQLVGTWEDDYQGKRTMTLRADGKGTMLVELSGMRARLFAARLTFEMEWSVEQGRLKKRTTGGQPAVAVQLILKAMGDRVAEPILELSDERLLLQDQDGKTKYDWRRPRRALPSPAP
jgi:hypothetical protein